MLLSVTWTQDEFEQSCIAMPLINPTAFTSSCVLSRLLSAPTPRNPVKRHTVYSFVTTEDGLVFSYLLSPHPFDGVV
jgi:hypothetical protein